MPPSRLLAFRISPVRRTRDHVQQFARGWGTGGAEDDPAVFADDEDGAGNPLELTNDHRSFGFESVVVIRDPQSLVDQEVKRQLELVDERLMTGGIALIHAKRFGVECPEIRDCLAYGGQLIASATRHVFGVEQQQGTFDTPK